MKTVKKRKAFNVEYSQKQVPISLIDASSSQEDFDRKELKTKATYFLLNGAPIFAVNESADGRLKLLASEKEFHAAKLAGLKECDVRIYSFNETHAECFSIVERLKSEGMSTIEQAYQMKRLISDFDFTQDDIASLVGYSRPAVANMLRLLTLEPAVLGLIESGKLSAGHARTLVRVPKEKQLSFAEEAIKRGYSVREMERAVKVFLTPPEVLQAEKQAKASAKSEQLKAFVERMRMVYRTKVSLVGNDKKGRIYIDYYSPEDLYRFEEFLDIIENR